MAQKARTRTAHPGAPSAAAPTTMDYPASGHRGQEEEPRAKDDECGVFHCGKIRWGCDNGARTWPRPPVAGYSRVMIVPGPSVTLLPKQLPYRVAPPPFLSDRVHDRQAPA
jgi:hypothetical protein